MPSAGFLSVEHILAREPSRRTLLATGRCGRSNPPGGKRSRVSHDDLITINSKMCSLTESITVFIHRNVPSAVGTQYKKSNSHATRNGEAVEAAAEK